MSNKVLVPKWLFFVLLSVISVLLLLTISFILTVRTASPTAMKLMLPKEESSDNVSDTAKPRGALTILLGKNDRIFFYEGELADDARNLRDSNPASMRKLIREKKASLGDKDFLIVIKPSNAATYKNTVDMLDEMTIDDVKKYAMVDITPIEEKLINER